MAKLVEMASQRLSRHRREREVAEAAVVHSETVKLLLERIDRIGWPAFIERLYAQRLTSPTADSLCVKLEQAVARVRDELHSAPAEALNGAQLHPALEVELRK